MNERTEGMNEQILHVITPGDHFSPRTGSATVTVVDGLSANRPITAPRPMVAVSRGTYPDRYDCADVLEYQPRAQRAWTRYADGALSRLMLPRAFARDSYRAALAGQAEWDPLTIVGHNAAQLIPVVDTERHRAVLYAHNDLLGTYSSRESGRVLSRASVIVAVSDFLAEQLSASLPASLRARVVVVRNGVDLSLFQPRPAPDGGRLRVMYVGRVIPSKGPDVLVRAVCESAHPDVELTVIGSAGFDPGLPLTGYEKELRRLAQPLGDRVTFHPFTPRKETARMLSTAHVVVVPSRWPEPFALTALEGMASGAAVIGSAIGGIPETVGGTGVLVPPDDVGMLASALHSFAQDRGLLEEVRKRCLAHARSRGWATVSAEFYAALAERR